MTIFTSLFSLLSTAASNLSGWFGFSTQKDQQLNTTAMQANAQAARERVELDRIAAEVTAAQKTGALDAVRREVAE